MPVAFGDGHGVGARGSWPGPPGRRYGSLLAPLASVGAGLMTPGLHDPWLRDGVTDCHSTRLDMYYVVGFSSDRTQVRQVDNPNK